MSTRHSRERVLAAVRREIPDRVPVSLAYEFIDDLCITRGKPQYVGRFKQDERKVSFKRIDNNVVNRDRFHLYLPNLPKEAVVNDWGYGAVHSSTKSSFKLIHPLLGLQKVRELKDYPFPNMMESWRHKSLEKEINRLHEQGFAVQGAMSQTVFEQAWHLRGMEQLFIDFFLNKEFASSLFDIITEVRCKMAERFVKAGVDILRLGDDIGSEKGMLMSPATWREWLKPRLKRVIDAAKEIDPEIPIFYHSDGDLREVIPELIEIGVTILNPVQPECMDPEELKKKYGDKLSFWGTIGTQTTMPFGKPEDVKRAVKKSIQTVGKGGGLVISPTHSIEKDVPWENIVALFEAVEQFGYYK